MITRQLSKMTFTCDSLHIETKLSPRYSEFIWTGNGIRYKLYFVKSGDAPREL